MTLSAMQWERELVVPTTIFVPSSIHTWVAHGVNAHACLSLLCLSIRLSLSSLLLCCHFNARRRAALVKWLARISPRGKLSRQILKSAVEGLVYGFPAAFRAPHKIAKAACQTLDKASDKITGHTMIIKPKWYRNLSAVIKAIHSFVHSFASEMRKRRSATGRLDFTLSAKNSPV